MLPPATSAKRRHGFKRSFPFCQFARSRADSLHGLRQQHAVRSPPARGGLRTAIVRLRVMWPFVRAHGRRGGKRRRDSERDRAKSWDRPQGRLRPFWKVGDLCGTGGCAAVRRCRNARRNSPRGARPATTKNCGNAKHPVSGDIRIGKSALTIVPVLWPVGFWLSN